MSRESAFTQAELTAYEKTLDSIRVEKTLMSGKFAEGRAEGRAEGMNEYEINIVRKFHQKGTLPEEIAALIDIPVERVREIIQM
ncbi:MAG: hypothetical protein LBR06_09870, partial [Bacteroidales bacterium]|jgi:predicted transposase YdaD|nr:hypothetical protein [Bacteroidales bacterium]